MISLGIIITCDEYRFVGSDKRAGLETLGGYSILSRIFNLFNGDLENNLFFAVTNSAPPTDDMDMSMSCLEAHDPSVGSCLLRAADEIPDNSDEDFRLLFISISTPLISRKTLRLLSEDVSGDIVICSNSADRQKNKIIEPRFSGDCQPFTSTASAARQIISNIGRDAIAGKELVDIINEANNHGMKVGLVSPIINDELFEVFDKTTLSRAERTLQKIQADQLMEDGLTLSDPARFDLRGELTFGRSEERRVGKEFISGYAVKRLKKKF